MGRREFVLIFYCTEDIDAEVIALQKRLNIIWRLLRGPVALFCKLKFGYTYKPAKDLPDHYIVLSNHTTDYDCVLVACSFKKQMYYVAIRKAVLRQEMTARLTEELLS